MSQHQNAQSGDEWNQIAPNNYYRPFPAMTLEQAISDKNDDVYISGDPNQADKGGITWWLAEPGVQGQSSFSSLIEAKKAGDKTIDKAYENQSRKIVESAGLDPKLWAFQGRGEVVFTNKTDEKVQITLSSPKKWDLWLDCQNDQLAGTYGSPKVAVEAYFSIPAAGL